MSGTDDKQKGSNYHHRRTFLEATSAIVAAAVAAGRAAARSAHEVRSTDEKPGGLASNPSERVKHSSLSC
jgi:hypothetical protein